MKKCDLHIHTVPTISDAGFTFSMDVLKRYVERMNLDVIAITNHNVFDLGNYMAIRDELDSTVVLPGIEVDLEGGHLSELSVLGQITAPVLYNNIRNSEPSFEPKRQQSLFLNDVQLHDIGQPPFSLYGSPLVPSVTPPLRKDHAYLCPLRTNGLYVLLHEETAHRICIRWIPRCQNKYLHKGL